MDVQSNRETKRNDALIATIISCVAAPLISHWLDMFIGPEINIWSSERLLVLFFSTIAGYVIWDKIKRVYNNTFLPDKGFHLENSGAFEQVIWTLPSIMVVMFYDTKFGASMIIIFHGMALLILCFDRQALLFNKRIHISMFLCSAIFIFYQRLLFPIEISVGKWLIVYFCMLIISMILWLFDEKYCSSKSKPKKSGD